MAPFSIALLVTMLIRVVVIHSVKEMRWDTRADAAAGVGNLTSASLAAVVITEALSVTEDIILVAMRVVVQQIVA